MTRLSILTSAAVALVLGAGGQAKAQTLELECQVTGQSRVTIDTRHVLRPEDPHGTTRAMGTWSVSVIDDTAAGLQVAWIRNSSPWGVEFNGHLTDEYLEFRDTAASISEDRIRWCPDIVARCGRRVTTSNGWYSVNPAEIDRRRATFVVRVDNFDELTGLRGTTTYSGPCAPRPEPQF
jgi:hypothetical protein